MRSDGTRSVIRPSRLTLARVSVLRGEGPDEGKPFIDEHIHTREPVVDYLTQFSGILRESGRLMIWQRGEPGSLLMMRGCLLQRATSTPRRRSTRSCRSRWRTRSCACSWTWAASSSGTASRRTSASSVRLGAALLGTRLAIPDSLASASPDIHVPEAQVIDTVDLYHSASHPRKLSLRFLSWFLLKQDIQSGTSAFEGHDSIEDAYAALRLYRMYEAFERDGRLADVMEDLYDEGRRVVSLPRYRSAPRRSRRRHRTGSRRPRLRPRRWTQRLRHWRRRARGRH